ncbi:hypothetical protein BJ165DRAFT_326226 [Panaeolus papilionaceus]|nr:hypothetical protein BJ165DRAFT_326226 [Panaeolus papilionaceus]
MIHVGSRSIRVKFFSSFLRLRLHLTKRSSRRFRRCLSGILLVTVSRHRDLLLDLLLHLLHFLGDDGSGRSNAVGNDRADLLLHWLLLDGLLSSCHGVTLNILDRLSKDIVARLGLAKNGHGLRVNCSFALLCVIVLDNDGCTTITPNNRHSGGMNLGRRGSVHVVVRIL